MYVCIYVCMYVNAYRVFVADSLIVWRSGGCLLVLVLQKGLVIVSYFNEHHFHSSSTHLFSFRFREKIQLWHFMYIEVYVCMYVCMYVYLNEWR